MNLELCTIHVEQREHDFLAWSDDMGERIEAIGNTVPIACTALWMKMRRKSNADLTIVEGGSA